MESILKIEVRNSDLKTPKEKRVFLTYQAEGLASCILEEMEDGVIFSFETKNNKSAKEISKKPKEEALRFLMNISSLFSLHDEYDFSLSPQNLLVDENLMAKVLIRDAKDGEEDEFLSKYKALIGCVLLPKYKYEDFLEGGEGLFKKKKFLSRITSLNSIEEIEEVLLEEYKKTLAKNKQTKRLISKKQVFFAKVTLPLLVVGLGVSAFFLFQAYFTHIPYGNSMIEARNAYISGDPLMVQYTLRDYEVHELSYETKYILSRSFVVTEVLTGDQVERILTGLTLRTEERIFDYWIHLGRLEMEEAIDIALRFNDNELLLLAYLKYEVIVLGDPNYGGDGEERTALITRIENQINSLTDDRETAREQMFEEREENEFGSTILENLEEEGDQW